MAQLAEQLICNQQVIGSSPIIGFVSFLDTFGWIPEWPKGADCKSVGSAYGGSNPPAPTIKETSLVYQGKRGFFIDTRPKTWYCFSNKSGFVGEKNGEL